MDVCKAWIDAAVWKMARTDGQTDGTHARIMCLRSSRRRVWRFRHSTSKVLIQDPFRVNYLGKQRPLYKARRGYIVNERRLMCHLALRRAIKHNKRKTAKNGPKTAKSLTKKYVQ